jgi:hypothetical protein
MRAMELIAIIVAGVLGWQHGRLGTRELKIIALVVVGWSAVTSAASVPYLTLGSLAFDLFFHAVVVAVPYGVGALARRVAERRG